MGVPLLDQIKDEERIVIDQIKRWTLMPIKRLRQEKAPLLGHLSSFRQISQAVSVAFYICCRRD